MSLNLEHLIAEFYDYFLDLYHQTRNGRAGAAVDEHSFLAFNVIGTPITPEMFKLQDGSFYEPLVTEQFSMLANMLPELEGATICAPGLLTVDSAYDSLLAQAQPLTSADMSGLGSVKGTAEQLFDQAAESPLIRGGIDYHPALPIPPNWPLPGAENIWVNRQFVQTEAVSTSNSSPPKRRPKLALWRWRVAPKDLSEAIKNYNAINTTVRPIQIPALTSLHAARASILTNRPVSVRRLSLANSTTSAIVSRPRPEHIVNLSEDSRLAVTLKIVKAHVMNRKLLELRKRSEPQAVTSRSLKLSFQYCLVTARRPWLSGAFLTARNWYIPRFRAGEIASGTGKGDGIFEVMPTAALCIRNLTIEAEWSAEEKVNLPNFSKLGPFSLVGKTFGGNSLHCPGMQVVGWIFEPMPLLPQNSDPSLA